MSEITSRFAKALGGRFLLVAAVVALPACNPEAKRLRESCRDGNVADCNVLGGKVLRGERVLQDEGRAASLFQQACDGGEVEGCVSLGRLYHTGRGVAEDFLRAASLYQQACDGGAMQGCTSLGAMY
jgi:TPR repeat protein